jgi:hypothetical protein
MCDFNCKKDEEDGHYVWKPFLEKNTFVSTELRTIDWPSDLTEWIDFHLSVVRPRICEINDLEEIPSEWWLNTQGTPIARTTGTQWFKSFLSETIGIQLNFRDYRWCQCATENAYPSSPEEHERFLYLSDHTQSTVDVSYKMIRDLPREKGKYETLSFHQSIRGLDSVSIDYQGPHPTTSKKKKKNNMKTSTKTTKTTVTIIEEEEQQQQQKYLVGDEKCEIPFEMNMMLF